MVRFCPQCGFKLPASSSPDEEQEFKFCPKCGFKLENLKEEDNFSSGVKLSEKKDVLICDNCGEENIPEAEVCIGCGIRLKQKVHNLKAQTHRQKSKQNYNVSKKQKYYNKPDAKITSEKNVNKKLNVARIITFSAIGLGIAAVIIIYSVILNPVIIPGPNKTASSNQSSSVDLASINKINELEAEIKSNPKDTSAILDLAHFKNDAGMFEQAIVNYKQYLALVPNDPNARIDMGVCYYNLQNYNEAIAQMERAVKYDPKHQIGYLDLGIVNLAAGNMAKSKEWLKKAVSLDPNSDYGKKAEELLKSHENTNQTNGGK
jgi:tetratricopeptide (TPR) repeat protein